MGLAMGFAGLGGMLRRTLYPDLGPYEGYMIAAAVGGMLMAAGLVVFVANLVRTVGVRGLLGVFLPQRKKPVAA